MTAAFYVLLGYAIIFIITFLMAYSAVQLVIKLRPIYAAIMVIFVSFTTIININKSHGCECLLNNNIFQETTKWFFDKILPLIAFLIPVYMLLLGVKALFQGERSIVFRVLLESSLHIMALAFLGLIVSSIITFYSCPMICGSFIDTDTANENIWKAIRKWLGTEN